MEIAKQCWKTLQTKVNTNEFDYFIEGTFNNFIYNLLYVYLIKVSANLELNYIKKAIESSEINHSTSRLQTLTK